MDCLHGSNCGVYHCGIWREISPSIYSDIDASEMGIDCCHFKYFHPILYTSLIVVHITPWSELPTNMIFSDIICRSKIKFDWLNRTWQKKACEKDSVISIAGFIATPSKRLMWSPISAGTTLWQISHNFNYICMKHVISGTRPIG